MMNSSEDWQGIFSVLVTQAQTSQPKKFIFFHL